MTPRYGDLPIVRWDGTAPTTLIADLEAHVAAGMRFAVLSATSPLGHGSDRALLARWWSVRGGYFAGLCMGWAVLVSRADVDPALLARRGVWDSGLPFPVRLCADHGEALSWLCARLAQAGPVS